MPRFRFLLLTSLLPALCLHAEDPPATTTATPTEVSEVVDSGKAEDLLGQVPAASQGQASAEDLLSRPILRRGEIMETIPGLIVTQHSGDGKANQYFLRGFNLDHGTDFATDIEGMPMNMRTHAHGQGYTDLNPLIPETADHLDYVKGTYTAANGDLSTAGSASFHLYDALPSNLISTEIGEHSYLRALIAGTIDLDHPNTTPDGKESKDQVVANNSMQRGLTYAFEYDYYNGPWALPGHSARETMMLRYFDGGPDDHFTATFMGYHGKWDSTDQIPHRALLDGSLSRFGNIDPTDGGNSQRYSLNFAWQHTDGSTTTRANFYTIYYDLNLFSDFTYFLNDPVHGDQFNQAEHRWVVGGNVSRTYERQTLFGKDAEYNIGLQVRNDIIPSIGLYHTEDRQRIGVFSQDRVFEASGGLYADATVHWSSWFRTVTGLRGDLYYFDTHSNTPANTGTDWAGVVSPKISAIFGPWHDTELYLDYGLGFHSNDARGVNATLSSTSGGVVDPATPLVRTQGAEFGIRTQAIPHLTSTLALFWLKLDSELVYEGDAGENVPGPPSVRYGIEWTNYWRPNDWFSLDAELALTHSRFQDTPPGQDLIPQSVPLMVSAGVTFGAQHGADGFFSTLRLRAFSKRPLDDNAFYDRPSLLFNGSIGYRHKAWETAIECLNLLNRHDNDIEYYYASRLPGEPAAGVNDVHLHPTEPRTFRLRVTYRF